MRAGRVLAIAALVGMATAVATPAAALEPDVHTGGWHWSQVHDTTTGISDATAMHRDVLGSGVLLKGWTEDAFDAYDGVDGYLSEIGFTHAVDPGLDAYVDLQPVHIQMNPGSATVTARAEGIDLGGGATLEVDVTLDIAGSFARWTIEFDDGGSGLVESIYGSGELGSPTTATPVGTDGLVVSGPSGLGPMIGLHVESDGTSDSIDASDPEFPMFESVGASTVVYTMALLEYDPCAESAAFDELVDLVPDFPSLFGEDLPPVLSNCLAVEVPAPLKAGVPADQVLELTLSGALAGGHPRLDNDSYFDYVDLWTSGLAVLGPSVPAGLALEIVPHPVTSEPALHLSGTPVAATSGAFPLRFYGVRNSPDFAGEMPIAANLRLDIAEGDPPPAMLPDTGVDAAPLVVGSGLLLLAGLALAARRRPRGTSTRSG